MTNNRAEFEAALDALRAVYRTGWRGRVVLCGDSQLVVNQVTGLWGCAAPHLVALRDRLRGAFTHFARVDVEWVPREENTRADALSRKAYEEARRALDAVPKPAARRVLSDPLQPCQGGCGRETPNGFYCEQCNRALADRELGRVASGEE
jgi:ribonuclease HI